MAYRGTLLVLVALLAAVVVVPDAASAGLDLGGILPGCTGSTTLCVDVSIPPGGSPLVACVNTMTDPKHCGNCDTKCGDAENCCKGVCKSMRDRENCGDCGVVCPTLFVCARTGLTDGPAYGCDASG